jgi:uncharacterized protein (DUF4415 family)
LRARYLRVVRKYYLDESKSRICQAYAECKYDFSKGRRRQAVPTKGKTRITIYIDDQIVPAFKADSARTGIGYQTLINEALGQHLGTAEKPITAVQVRKIVRDELAQVR